MARFCVNFPHYLPRLSSLRLKTLPTRSFPDRFTRKEIKLLGQSIFGVFIPRRWLCLLGLIDTFSRWFLDFDLRLDSGRLLYALSSGHLTLLSRPFFVIHMILLFSWSLFLFLFLNKISFTQFNIISIYLISCHFLLALYSSRIYILNWRWGILLRPLISV